MRGRRSFLKVATVGAAGAVLTPLRRTSGSALAAVREGHPPGGGADVLDGRRWANPAPGVAHAAPTDGEAYWELVKREFPLRQGLVMMNAANLCPSPFSVADEVTSLTRAVDSDASFQHRAMFGPLREAARQAVAAHVGADPDEIALTRNTSEGNNTIVSGLMLGPGDEVVVWEENHPTNRLAWQVRAARDGFTVRSVAIDPAGDLAGPLLEALTARTRVLAFSHLSNVSGVLLPAAELCAAARSRDILTLVDGAQTFGSHVLDLHAMGCDFYTASSHKWFVGPKEAGILYVRSEKVGHVWASDVGVGWEDAVRRGAQRFESLGQRDDACVSAMGMAASFHVAIGRERIEERMRELTETLVAELTRRVPGIRFAMPVDPSRRGGVVVFTVPGVDGQALYDRLYAEHDVAGAAMGGGVRLSPHVYNTLADVERAARAVERLAAG